MIEQIQDIKEISCVDLKKKMDASENFVLIDVREPEEFEVCMIPGSILIPLSEIEDHLDELDKDASYVLHCKMGGRSTKAAYVMKEKGFKSVISLKGGIYQWSQDIDKEMTLY
jgi:sulfur-carrier protein adenylyltransferase/sulfurtransferase